MRCFIAVELNDSMRAPLVRLLREGLPRTKDVRWCTEDQLHVTLKFLGEVGDDQMPQVRDVLTRTAAQVPPFEITLTVLGAFPSPRAARVLWAGIDDPAGGCQRWLELADPLLAKLGFEPETRAFTPHITLGRSKDRGGADVMRRVLESTEPLPPRSQTVDHLVLFESRLSPRGAQYLPVQKAALAGSRT